MTDTIIIFGWLCVVIFGLTVAIPYLRGTSDLMTTWNLFMVGAMNFVGFAAVQSGYGIYSYGLFESDEYVKLMLGTVAFFIPLYLVYYRTRLPGKVASRTLRKWPEYRGAALYPILAISVGIMIFGLAAPNVQFLGQLVLIVGPSAGIIATAVCFRAWWNNRLSGLLLVLTFAILAVAAVASVSNTTGRRPLLSALVVLPFCLYWLSYRYRPKVYTVLPIALAGFGVMLMMAGYSTIRHRYNSEQVNVADRTPIETAVESLQLLPTAILELNTIATVFGGDSMEASLVAIQYYTKVAPPVPFHTVKYVFANPFPRAWWPDTWGEKPLALGETLPRDIGVWTRRGYVNWGPGIPGHGFHEGGYLMLVLYGVLVAFALRYMDELLLRQPDNPYYLGMVAAASSQIIAYSRGDIGLFTVMVIGAMLTGLIIRWVGALITGYGLVYPTDRERAAMLQPAAVPQSDPDFAEARGGFAAMQN
ncbi:MAG TPA: hypothetical protein PLD59_05275 [Tepidisphaeraceae bacterium]|nr:hypothetical protein [Tepidisphaeraceae bacterium]